MQPVFLNNCCLVLSLAWNVLAHFSEVFRGIDTMIGNRGRFSGVVMPMATMAALVSLLSIIVYAHDYQHAVAEMFYVFGSFLFIYVVFVSLLNYVASKDWFTDSPAEFCVRAKSFVIALLLVHFDVTIISALFPSFRIAELIEFYVIYVSWTMTGPYLPVSRHRNAFGIIFGALFLVFIKMLHLVLVKSFPNMPI